MTRISKVIQGWLGWCPHAGALRTTPVVITALPITQNPSVPDGGAERPGRISRGKTLAVGSIRILLRHVRLLWFALLTGIVTLFSLAVSLYIQVASGTNPFPGLNLVTNPTEILIAKGSLLWISLTYVTAFISTFLTYFLLAGLILCVSSILSEREFFLWEGLSRAGDRIQSIAAWAVVGALLGTVSSFIMIASGTSIPVMILSIGTIYVFFILTIFVVPAMILDHVGVVHAICHSVSVFRKMWGEIIICFGILLAIAFAIYLLVLIPAIYFGFSSGSATTAGFVIILTMLVMIVLTLIGSTITGIATLGLYTCWKEDQLPSAFEGTLSMGGIP